jgi:Nif-specific regulatory protein
LNVVPIVLLPLRQRVDDIPLLLQFYIKKFNRLYGRNVGLEDAAVNRLAVYQWPGNVRELSNLVERLVIMAEADTIRAQDLPFSTPAPAETQKVVNNVACLSEDLGIEIERLERTHIVQALKQSNGVQQKASRVLGITPRQLGYRIKKYNIDLKSL